jgi:hypothetical protein
MAFESVPIPILLALCTMERRAHGLHIGVPFDVRARIAGHDSRLPDPGWSENGRWL